MSEVYSAICNEIENLLGRLSGLNSSGEADVDAHDDKVTDNKRRLDLLRRLRTDVEEEMRI